MSDDPKPTPMTLDLEPGTRHVLAACRQCPPWRELRGTRPAALLAAAVHAEQVHHDTKRAKQLRQQAARAK